MYTQQQHSARGVEQRIRIAREERFADLKPPAQSPHAADLGEMCCFILEGQGRIARQQLILGPHHFRHLRLLDSPILHGVAGQAAGVGRRQTREIANQQIQGLIGGADRPLAVIEAPLSGHVVNNLSQFIRSRQRQAKWSREGTQLVRDRQP